MEDYIQRTIKAYDDTQTYESSTELLTPQLELKQFMSLLPANALVLDAGCAYGRDTSYIASNGFRTKSIDLSPALISRAKVKFPTKDFAVRDVRDTGFDSETFDGIWCNATLLHLNDEDMEKALLEFVRILKPGGVLAASLKKGSGSQQFVEKFSSKTERYFNFQTHETFLAHLKSVGLAEIAWHYVNERERYGADKRDLDWLYSFSKKQG